MGRSFRNEITPGNFIFRTREFEQMELEFFCKPNTDLEWFKFWKDYCLNFLKELGSGFAFIDSEYKIKIGSDYHYIDFLLFNIEYNCYIVLELKITKLKIHIMIFEILVFAHTGCCYNSISQLRN